MVSTVLWGILIGGAAYASMVYFPAYLAHLPESSVVVNGPYGLSEGIFWMTIHPVLILSLIISLALNWKDRRRRNLIATSLSVYIAILVVTSLYFLPELSAFRDSPNLGLSNAEWDVRTKRWQILNVVRFVVLVACMFLLLSGLTFPSSGSAVLKDEGAK
jgi:uncharacterized membrane protein